MKNLVLKLKYNFFCKWLFHALVTALFLLVGVAAYPCDTLFAASHVHGDDCFDGERHVHVGNPSSGGACYKYVEGGLYPCPGGGTYVEYNRTTGLSAPCRICNSAGNTGVVTTIHYGCTYCGNNYCMSYSFYTCSVCGYSDPNNLGQTPQDGKPHKTLVDSRYELNCSKSTTAYYDASGNVCAPKCSQIVTNISPSEPTQILLIGEEPNCIASVTFLNGEVQNVIANVSDFDSSIIGTEQVITLSYGAYYLNAKNPGPASAQIRVTIYGTFNVSFDANGGECSELNRDILFGNSYGALPVPTKQGYTFNGWIYNGIAIDATTKMNVPNDHTLVADWLPNPHNMITIDINGVTGTQSSTQYYNSTVSLSAGNKVDSVFNGWTVVKGTVSDFDLSRNSIEFTMPDEDVILRANWKDVFDVSASLNSLFYDTYSAQYTNSLGYCIDDGSISISNDMVDVSLNYKDGSHSRVQSSEFFISGGVLSEIGEYLVIVTVPSLSRNNIATFTVTTYSQHLSDIISSLDVSSYEGMVNYISNLKSEHETLVDELANYSLKLDELRIALNAEPSIDIVFGSDLQTNLSAVCDGIDEIVTKINSYNGVLDVIQNAIISCDDSLGPEFSVSDGQFTTIMNQISTLKSSYHSSIDNANELRSQLASTIATLSRLQAECEEKQSLIDEQQDTIDSLTAEGASKDSVISQLHELLSQLMLENEGLISNIDSLNARIQNLINENLNLNSLIASNRSELIILQEELNALSLNHSSLGAEEVRLQSVLAGINNTLDSLISVTKSNDKTIIDLTNKNESLKSSISTLLTDIDSLRDSSAALDSSIRDLSDKLYETQLSVEGMTIENENLKAELDNIQPVVSGPNLSDSSVPNKIIAIEHATKEQQTTEVEEKSDDLSTLLLMLDNANLQLSEKNASISSCMSN